MQHFILTDVSKKIFFIFRICWPNLPCRNWTDDHFWPSLILLFENFFQVFLTFFLILSIFSNLFSIQFDLIIACFPFISLLDFLTLFWILTQYNRIFASILLLSLNTYRSIRGLETKFCRLMTFLFRNRYKENEIWLQNSYSHQERRPWIYYTFRFKKVPN